MNPIHFDAVATAYDKAAFLQAAIAKKLMQKAMLIKDAPTTIVDLGAGSGILSSLLVDHYPDSKITAVDYSPNMCAVAAQKPGFEVVCADARQLPFSDWSYRAVFSNCMLQWAPDYQRVLQEVKRVLAPGGFFLLSTFGPKTLPELRRAGAAVDDYKHVNEFVSMQELADQLSTQGFIDVVVSSETIVVHYDRIRKIFQDLKDTGATNVMSMDKYQGLMTQRKLARFYKAYEEMRSSDGHYPVSYEVIYAIAWVPENGANQGPHVVSVDHLRNLMQKFQAGEDDQ